MNKKEFIQKLADKANISNAVAEMFLTHTCETIQEALMKGDSITLPGLGKLETKTRACRQGRNPQTGALIHIPSKTVAGFKASSELKRLLEDRQEEHVG